MDGVAFELVTDGENGVVDPGADFWVSLLADGVIVGAGREEGDGWIEIAKIENLVDKDSKVGLKSVEKCAVSRQEIIGYDTIGWDGCHVSSSDGADTTISEV